MRNFEPIYTIGYVVDKLSVRQDDCPSLWSNEMNHLIAKTGELTRNEQPNERERSFYRHRFTSTTILLILFIRYSISLSRALVEANCMFAPLAASGCSPDGRVVPVVSPIGCFIDEVSVHS